MSFPAKFEVTSLLGKAIRKVIQKGNFVQYSTSSQDFFFLGESSRVNRWTLGWQDDPRVAALTNNTFVAVWTSERQDGSSTGIVAQIFDSSGTRIGNEFLVNSQTQGTQDQQRVVAHPDGGFIVAWSGRDGDGNGVFAQRFNSSGDRIGSEFRVNEITAGSQNIADIAISNEGVLFVSYSEFLGNLGNVFRAEILEDPYHEPGIYIRDNSLGRSRIEALDDGTFIASWNEENSVLAQRFSSAGEKVGGAFQVNFENESQKLVLDIQALEDGGFVILWQSQGQDGDREGVFGQIFDANGGYNGDEFQLNSVGAGRQYYPSAASLQDGGFLVSWNDDSEFWMQRFDADYEKIGPELNISDSATFWPKLATSSSGTTMFIWEDDEIYMRMAHLNSEPEGNLSILGTARQGETLSYLAEIMDRDGIDVATVSARWYRDGQIIDDVNSNSYILTQEDVGASISVEYYYTDILGTTERVFSYETDLVGNVNNDPVGIPRLIGVPNFGETLIVDTSAISDDDGIDNSTKAVQWLRDGVAIQGAIANSYVVGLDDVGSTISVRYSYTDNFGVDESVTSSGTATITIAGETITGTPAPDQLVGGMGADTILGLASDDTITGSAGNDQIDGGEGADTVAYSGDQASFTVTLSPTGTSVTDRRPDGNGTDNLTDIEILDFDSGTFDPLNLSVFGGPASLSDVQLESFIELYIAYFNRAPDAIGLNFWGTAFANGLTLAEMAAQFGPQDETQAAYSPGTSNEVFAITVYDNVLGRTPDQAGIDFWVGQLDLGNVSRDQFILNVLQGAKSDLKPELGPDFVAQQLADQAYLENKIDIGAYFAVHKGMSDVDNAAAAMALFDGSQTGISNAVAAIDSYYSDAIDPTDGEFLMPLIGVLDDPFGIA